MDGPVRLTRPYTERRLRQELDAHAMDLVIKKDVYPPYTLRAFYARCRVSGREVQLGVYGRNVRPDYKRMSGTVESLLGPGIVWSV